MMQTRDMAKANEDAGTTAAAAPRVALNVAAPMLLAALSPLALLAPQRFVRGFAAYLTLVPAWQVAILAAFKIHRIVPNVAALGYRQSIVYLVEDELPVPLLFGLLWALAAFMTRPIGAAWDESSRRSFWKSGMVALAFALPVPLLVHGLDRLLWSWSPYYAAGRGPALLSGHGYAVISNACVLAVVSLAIIQTIRGLACVGGGSLPALPPICRDCGYSLEGAACLIQAGLPRGATATTASTVCPECGCDLAASLDAAGRRGTAWTRGDSRSPAAWLATAGQGLWHPVRFFSRLPLGAPRRAALWFWLYGIPVTLVLVTAVLAADLVIASRMRRISPLYAPTDSLPMAAATPPLRCLGVLGVLEAVTLVAGIALAIAATGAAVQLLAGSWIGRMMSRRRERNVHPAGLLVACYTCPAALGAGVLVLAAGVAARLIGHVALPGAPLVVRRFASDGQTLAVQVWIGGAILAAACYCMVARRAAWGIRYANMVKDL